MIELSVPHNPELEQSAIACLFNFPDSRFTRALLSKLSVNDFLDETARAIVHACKQTNGRWMEPGALVSAVKAQDASGRPPRATTRSVDAYIREAVRLPAVPAHAVWYYRQLRRIRALRAACLGAEQLARVALLDDDPQVWARRAVKLARKVMEISGAKAKQEAASVDA